MGRLPAAAHKNVTTMHLGDPEEGPGRWLTEYDTEFSHKLGLPVDAYVPHQRPSPRTPRSLKQGFVHQQEYERLESQYLAAKAVHTQLQIQLAAMEARLGTARQGEARLIASVQDEHAAVARVREQIHELAGSLGGLLERVEMNKSFITTLSAEQHLQLSEDRAPPPADPLTRRLSSMEEQLSQLVTSVSHLAAAQQQTLAGADGHRGPQGLHQARIEADSARRRKGRRGLIESVEVMPQLLRSTASYRQAFWKP